MSGDATRKRKPSEGKQSCPTTDQSENPILSKCSSLLMCSFSLLHISTLNPISVVSLFVLSLYYQGGRFLTSIRIGGLSTGRVPPLTFSSTCGMLSGRSWM